MLTPDERAAGFYIEFVIDDLLTANAATRATTYAQYRSMGAMTANEVRAGLNMPPRDGGDTLDNTANPDSATEAHPVFVELLKKLGPLEARILEVLWAFDQRRNSPNVGLVNSPPPELPDNILNIIDYINNVDIEKLQFSLNNLFRDGLITTRKERFKIGNLLSFKRDSLSVRQDFKLDYTALANTLERHNQEIDILRDGRFPLSPNPSLRRGDEPFKPGSILLTRRGHDLLTACH